MAHKCEVLAVAMKKGGVGKTTVSLGIYDMLSNVMGKKCLMIDMDSQGNATKTMKGSFSEFNTCNLLAFSKDEMQGKIEDYVQETDNGYVIPSNKLLKDIDRKVVDMNRYYNLWDKLPPLKEMFDYIIFDCPPETSLCTTAALVCTDRVIIPSRADSYSFDQIPSFFETIVEVRNFKGRLGMGLEIAGILYNFYDKRKRIVKNVEPSFQQLAEKLGTKVFQTKIRQNTTLQEAQLMRQLLSDYDDSHESIGFKDFQDFVEELMNEK